MVLTQVHILNSAFGHRGLDFSMGEREKWRMAVRKEAGEAVLMYGLQWGKHWVGVGYRPSTVVPWSAPPPLAFCPWCSRHSPKDEGWEVLGGVQTQVADGSPAVCGACLSTFVNSFRVGKI